MSPDKRDHIYITIIVVVLLILFIYYCSCKYEHLGEPWFLDQMSMNYSDPTWFNFMGNQRDVAGMSSKDYYLENQLNSSTGAGPQYFKNDTNFVDHTNYMDMPIKYRPLRNTSAAAAQIQSEIKSNNMEENLYLDLNDSGFY